MIRHLAAAGLSFVLVWVLAACANESTGDGDPTEVETPCGIVSCSAPDDDGSAFDAGAVSLEGGIGKADAVDRVQTAIIAATRDGDLDLDDIGEIFDSAGRTISPGEIRVIHHALTDDNATYEVSEAAAREGRRLAFTANLSDAERDHLEGGVSFGGTPLPDAVVDAVVRARFQGAVAYDVNERDDDGEGIWSPYPATTPAYGNMAFDYTEITPTALSDDANDTDVIYQAIIGSETATTASGQEYKRAKYEERQGGTGHVLAHYDEVYHPDIYARGSQGQKWASNMAILSDGTIHCLPAARRSVQQNIILTNPHLSRGVRLLYNGHLEVRDGVVEGIEMSGRLSKMAARGKAIFIDPVPLLEAWGFAISDHVRLRYGNTSDGTPVQTNGVIQEGTDNDA